MYFRRFLISILLSCLSAFAAESKDTSSPAEKGAVPKPKQWVYVLRLVERLHDDAAWSEADKAIVGRHFSHLEGATRSGRVILAGRTIEAGAKTFGLVIFEANDEAAARAFMESDPSVAEKIMTAELYPYYIALQRKEKH